MTPTELQVWLNAHGAAVVPDGKIGPASRAAIVQAFTNTCADAVTDGDIETYAKRLGCSTKQVRAVAKVESGGGAYDNKGRPKILFERHLFYRLTHGKFGITAYSNPKGGGYSEDSWDKLGRAAAHNPDAAFSAISWGKFQVLGSHWQALDYPSPLDLAYSTVVSEAGHYDLLCRFIEANNLSDEIQALSTNPETCRAFARKYNGPAYEKFSYHTKLAAAMK